MMPFFLRPVSEVPISLIIAEDVTKKYNGFTAVDEIKFSISDGSHGFLGPNGAGKTTLMRMISTLSPITSGSLLVDGMSVGKDHETIKSILGVVPQFDNLDPDLTVLHNLLVYSRFFSIPKKEAVKRVDELIDFMHLTEKREVLPNQLSGGMRKRLLIARALLNNPKILILDEPTAGLDPKMKREIWQKLQELNKKGITLLITTHDMQEGEVLCDEVFVMDQGKIIADGSPLALIEKTVGAHAIELPINSLREIQSMAAGRATIYPRADNIVVTTNDVNVIQELNKAFRSENPTTRKANLEDVFLALTGREVG